MVVASSKYFKLCTDFRAGTDHKLCRLKLVPTSKCVVLKWYKLQRRYQQKSVYLLQRWYQLLSWYLPQSWYQLQAGSSFELLPGLGGTRNITGTHVKSAAIMKADICLDLNPCFKLVSSTLLIPTLKLVPTSRLVPM